MNDESSFDHWLNTAELGSPYSYFTGYNPRDSGVSPEALHTAVLAKRAFADGKVELGQRRITGEGKWGPFIYLAIKRKEERTPQANDEPWVPRIIGPGKGHCS
jgi:hypothetical protein